MENVLFQIVESRYIKGETKVHAVHAHRICLDECQNIMHKMYKREGFFIKHRQESVEFYTDTHSHWKIKLEIIKSGADDNLMKFASLTHRAHPGISGWPEIPGSLFDRTRSKSKHILGEECANNRFSCPASRTGKIASVGPEGPTRRNRIREANEKVYEINESEHSEESYSDDSDMSNDPVLTVCE